MSMSTHARSMRALREKGWQTGPLHYRGDDGKTHDLWAFADWIACKPGFPLTLGQSTTIGQKRNHANRIRWNENARRWVEAGGGVMLHCWFKEYDGARRREVWRVDVTTFSLADFERF